jgi:hypothetical protein
VFLKTLISSLNCDEKVNLQRLTRLKSSNSNDLILEAISYMKGSDERLLLVLDNAEDLIFNDQ